MSASIEFLQSSLGAKAYNALVLAEVRTVEDLKNRGAENILAIRNFGPISYDKLRQALSVAGYRPNKDVGLPKREQ